MFSRILISAIRQLYTHKLFSAINIGGLAVGMAACCLILLYVQNETSWDRHWQHGERLYRVNTTFDLPGRAPFRLSTGSALLLPALREYFGEEIEAASRARALPMEFRLANDTIAGTVVAVEPEFLDLFALETVQGSLPATLGDGTSIALSAPLAQTLFGTPDALGQVVSLEYLDERIDYRVTAVYRLPPHKSVLDLPAMVLFDPDKDDFELQRWTRSPLATWIRLAPGADVNAMNARMNAFSDQYADISAARAGPDVKPSDILRYAAQRIDDIHLDADFEDANGNGNRNTVEAFSIIAVLILLVACINFTNLSTARATQVARAVTVRKVVGATHRHLVLQFLGEAACMVVLALALALALVELVRPLFALYVGTDLDFFSNSSQTWLGFGALLLLTLAVSGLYPALLMVRGSPAAGLKGYTGREPGRPVTVRGALVVFQFGVAVALLIATGIIYLQIQFISRRDPGFDGNNLIVIEDLNSRAAVSAQRHVLKQRILELPGVTNASLSGHRPLADTVLARTSNAFELEGEQGSNYIIPTVVIDENFVATYDMELLAGRLFSLERDLPAQFSPAVRAEDIGPRTALVNASAARQLGFAAPEDALGAVLSYPSQYPGVIHTYEVVGVLADTQFYSLKTVPRPELYAFVPTFGDVLAVRYSGSPQVMMARLNDTWNEVMGQAVYTATFLDTYLDREFAREKLEGILLVVFAGLAIFIACLGLYGSAVFTMGRRTKELGIRRVMGAQISELVAMLLWQFSRPVLLANLLAWPVALWAMLDWLQRFPYRIDSLVLLPLCVLAGTVALSIAWLTVIGNAVHVTSRSPVHALRYE